MKRPLVIVTPRGVNLPIGAIALWSGLVDDIPSGWVLCDGSGGTPDTTDKYILGATNAGDLLGTGGAIQHRHAAGGAQSGGSHSHSVSFTTDAYYYDLGEVNAGTYSANSGHTHAFSGSTDSVSHTHGSGGNSGYASNEPPFHRLYHVMRVS
jgi:hypothetical protein